MVLKIEGFERHDVDGATITAQAQGITSKAGDVENFDASLESSHNTATSGVAGTLSSILEGADAPTRNAGRTLVQRIMSGGGTVRQFGGHVTDFDSTVALLNIQISTEETVEDQRAKKASLQGRYATATQSLETQAQTAARQLRNPLDVATITALYRAGALPSTSPAIFSNVVPDLAETVPDELPSDLADMTDEERLEHIRSNPDFDPGLVPLLPLSTQTLAGEQVAGEIRDNELDLQTVQLMNLFGKQEPFAATVYRNVTPDELADTIKELSDDVFPNGAINSGVSASGTSERVDPGQRQFYQDFLTAAGTTLATYSRSSDPLWKAPDDYGHTWGSAITDEDNPENAGALGMVLRYGGADEDGYGERFLSDAADDVYTYERSKDGDPVWGPRGPLVMDPGARMDNADDNVFGIQHNDALSDVLGAMEHSPEAAQQFFADGFPEDGDGNPDLTERNERLQYLMEDRTFANDAAGTRAGDEGDGLGKALAAAAIGNRDGSELTGTGVPHDEMAATIATQTFQTIADKHGTGDQGYIWNKVDNLWHPWPEMTDSIGQIAGAYINDTYDISQSDGRGGSPFWDNEDGPAGLSLSKEDLGLVYTELGAAEDRTGLEIATTAAVTYNNDLTSAYLSNHQSADPNAPLTIDHLREAGVIDDLNIQASNTGNALDFILGSGLEGDRDEEEFQQARAEVLQKAFDTATSFIPSPQGQVASTLTSEGIGLISDRIGEAETGGADSAYHEANTQMKTNIEYGTYNALIANGYLDPQHDSRYGIPPSALVDGPNGGRMIDPELYDGEAGDVTRPGGEPGRTAEQEYLDWKEGPDPTTQQESEYNGPPADIFQAYLDAYAGHAYGER